MDVVRLGPPRIRSKFVRVEAPPPPPLPTPEPPPRVFREEPEPPQVPYVPTARPKVKKPKAVNKTLKYLDKCEQLVPTILSGGVRIRDRGRPPRDLRVKFGVMNRGLY